LFPEEFDDLGTASGDEAPQQLVAPPPQGPAEPPQIRTLWLEHFKRFGHLQVDLAPFNVLAGPNNSGKSTILQAIDLFYSLLKVLREGEGVTPRSRYIPSSLLPVAAGPDIFYGGVQRHGNVPVEAVVRVRFADGSEVAIGIRSLFGAWNCRIVDANETMTIQTFQALISRPAVWIPSSVGIVRDEEYRTAARRAGLVSAGRNNEILRNLLLELKRHRPERFDRLQDVLRQRFEANVRDVDFEELTDQFLRALYATETGLQHDLYSAGAGFIQILQLLTFVFGRDASLVLLDEPDAHLHSSMQRVVVEILEELAKSQSLQIVLSTHSKEIINFVDPSRLILIDPDVAHLGPATDSVATIAALRSVGDIDNVDAFELVQSGKCLFLEGSEDKRVLSRFAATSGMTIFTGSSRVVPIVVSGAYRFEHVQQLDVIEEFLGRKISSLEIRDRDGLLDERRESVMAGTRRPLRIWWRDCVESYLIHPLVLARLVNDLIAERGGAGEPTDEDMAQITLACCDELRDNTVDRVSAAYIDARWAWDRERASVQEANQAAREAVGRDWATLEGRLKWVSGKALLSCIRRRIQERYGVSFGNERLAEAFLREEIPDELLEALGAIEAIG